MTTLRWTWLALNAADEASTQAMTATGWANELNPVYASLHPLLSLAIKVAATTLIFHLLGRIHRERPRVAGVVGGCLCLWIALIVANTAALTAAILT